MTDQHDPTENFKNATQSTARALSGRDDLDVSFSGHIAEMGDTSIRLPALPKDMSEDDTRFVRGLADNFALRLRYHDATLHSRLLPADAQAKAVYEALEDARIEAVGTADYPGAAANIETTLKRDAKRLRLHLVKGMDDAPLAEALRYLAREAFTRRPVPAEAAKTAKVWKQWIAEHLGEDGLEALHRAMHDQEKFARLAQQMIERMEMVATPAEPPRNPEDGDSDDDEDAKGADTPNEDGSPKTPPPVGSAEESDSGDTAEQQMDAQVGNDLEEMDDDSATSEDDEPRRNEPRENAYETLHGDYKIYCTNFDEVVQAKDLCDAEELQKLRKMLDKQLTQMQGVITRLANRLQRKLMAQQTRAWQFDLEEGILDSARLSRVVTNPLMPISYKQESETDFRDTVVTLLIDNSGSMRGRPITIAAMSTDILARTLERCGVKVEILGFTTRAWKGGSSRERWLADGKPQTPGRLNDLRHIVYKGADNPWRHCRANLGLMLREGLLKENIDGEALMWAYERLMYRPEQRKILMVISDGAPVDDSTLSANQGNYLEEHLRRVIHYIENKSPVQLLAIGIGHDVTRYYERAVTLVDAEELGGAITEKLAELFDEKQPARKKKRG
ncbi:MAG TPA: cobaltochelatase subunit CobT [Alphaproteobacteria bacterium]|nr:cobaltochelatase subunit CobT [Alphaproteobacteria bacterium]